MSRSPYVDWPAIVHLETVAVCNAACDFCPYVSMERKGQRMSDQLIEKIINDLRDIPYKLPFQLLPYKVSDPFLDVRLFEILDLVNEKLPNAQITIFTNGAALTEQKILHLSKVRNISSFFISLNYIDPLEYEEVMKIPFGRTIRNVDTLHRLVCNGTITFPVEVKKVSAGLKDDREFIRWVGARYPAFGCGITPRNDWIGDVPDPEYRLRVPDAPCGRWFDLSITATGIVAKCCMDGHAKYAHGNVTEQHALGIYNQPHLRALRKNALSRLDSPEPCKQCTYLNT